MTYASVRGPLTPGATTMIVPATGTLGFVILVPATPPAGSLYGTYYNVLVYVGISAGPTAVTLPALTVAGNILVVDLPSGVAKPLAEIAAAITKGKYGGVPQGIGPQPAFTSYAANPQLVPPGALYAVSPAAGALGTVLLVPEGPPAGSGYGSFYTVLAYVSASASATNVSVPDVIGVLSLDLPNGIFTPSTEIAAAITSGASGGPPTGVGPT